MPKFLDAVKGFGVTFGTMFKPAITRYPEEPGAVAPRYHGRHQLNRYPTGWRSASAASCAPGHARPTPSTSRAPTTRSPNGFPRVNATGGCTRSTICVASAAGCASRPAPPGR